MEFGSVGCVIGMVCGLVVFGKCGVEVEEFVWYVGCGGGGGYGREDGRLKMDGVVGCM